MVTLLSDEFATLSSSIEKHLVTPSPPVKIWQVSKSLREYFLLRKRLEEDLKHIEIRYVDMDTVSWMNWCDHLTSLRNLSLVLKRSLNFELAHRLHLKRQINKRKKKRRNRRCTSDLAPSKHEISALHRLYLQQNANKEKQKEKLKFEADSVLFSVRQKKIEAKHHIRLLAVLRKLHSARVRDSSFSCTDSSREGFVKIIDKLTILWNNHLKEYIFEENGLNIMLKYSMFCEENEYHRNVAHDHSEEDCTYLKRNYAKWLTLMFGSNDLQNALCYSSAQEFFCIRQEWDQFVCDRQQRNASKIPVGWITPKHRCNDFWSDFIQN